MMNMNRSPCSWWSSLKGLWVRGLALHGRLGLVQQIRNVLADLGDVVEGVLGLAVQVRERSQTDDAGDEDECSAVHSLRDALRQQRYLLRRVDTGDAGERLDETRDGSQEAREGRQVTEHGQVAGPLLELRQLAE